MSQQEAKPDSDHPGEIVSVKLADLIELCDKYDLPDEVFEDKLKGIIDN